MVIGIANPIPRTSQFSRKPPFLDRPPDVPKTSFAGNILSLGNLRWGAWNGLHVKPLNLMVACAENRSMGLAGRHPWHPLRIAEDMRIFHEQTAGQTVVLGRICFESWPRAALDGRRPVVITSNPSIEREGVRIAPSLPAALAIADALPGEICVTGGERIFEEALALPRPLTLHLTLVHAQMPGDRFFPEWRHLPWRETGRRESADEHFRYTFFTLERPR